MTTQHSRRNLRRAQLLSLIGVLILVAAAFAAMTQGFAELSNLRNILLDASPTIIGAVAMTLIIVTRGIDLSIGSIANFALATAIVLGGTKTSQIITETTPLVYPVALVAGLALGLANGFFITKLDVNPLIATLGTMTLYRGLGLHLTGASLYTVQGSILDFGRGQLFSVGLPVFVASVVTVGGWSVLARTVFGRHLLALGGSPRSANETGIQTTGLLLAVYGIAGFCGALSGLIVVGRVGVLTSELGFGFEFTVITAVVLGGTSLFGGRGSIVGSTIGAILLTVIQNGLNLIGADPYIYDVVRGAILLFAVSADMITGKIGSPKVHAFTQARGGA